MPATLNYYKFNERPYGADHLTEADTINRALKQLVNVRMQVIRDQVFNGQTGKTVSIPTALNATNYMVAVISKAVSGFIGEISIGTKALNSVVVYNTGSDVTSTFDLIVIDLS
jgi:hypothetical protein